jgi:Carboxypeptidase regulatory-like domain
MWRFRHFNTMRVRVASLVKLLFACCALAPAARAQVLTGTVVDSIARFPVPGVVVILLDSAGGTVARNLTNERGEYRVTLRDAARMVRFVRIGFAPGEFPLPARGAVTRLDIAMVPLPNLIQAVHVIANSRCRVRKDRAQALGLWEQARAGLLATIVAREENPGKVVRLGFYRVMDGNSEHVERMRVESDSADGTGKTYTAAAEAADFVRFGFSTDSLASATYYGPDADVLLSDAFGRAYCFEIADRDRSRPHQIGLRFTPADPKKGRVDIDGTLWIDSVAKELRDVQYKYLNVEAGARRFNPGGYVSFHAMKNGVVLIDRWWIRLVNATPDTTIDIKYGGLRFDDWVYAEEDGGELARAAWPDGLEWRASLGALRLRVLGTDKKPAPGTVISLVATHYFGTSDANGIVEIKELLPGPYSVRIIDPRIAELGIGWPTSVKFVATRDTTSVATLIAPTTESRIADRCVANHHWTVGDSLFTIGRVLTPDGKPVGDARIDFFTKSSAGQWMPGDAYYTTGTDGMFEFCHRFAPQTEVKYRVTRQDQYPLEVVGTFTSSLLVVKLTIAHP